MKWRKKKNAKGENPVASVGLSSLPPSPKKDKAFWEAIKSRSVKASRNWRWPAMTALSAIVTFFAMPFVEPRPAMIVATVISFLGNGFLKRRVRKSLKRSLLNKGVPKHEAILISNADANAETAFPSLGEFVRSMKTVSDAGGSKLLLRAWSLLRRLNASAFEIICLSLIATLSAWTFYGADLLQAITTFFMAMLLIGSVPAIIINFFFYAIGTLYNPAVGVDKKWASTKRLLDGDYFAAEAVVLEALEQEKRTCENSVKQLSEGEAERVDVFQPIPENVPTKL